AAASASRLASRRPPMFQYTEEASLPAAALRRRAEREAEEAGRDWLAVNLPNDWATADGGRSGGGGGIGVVDFSLAVGRANTTRNRRSGSGGAGPGAYETEARAVVDRFGRIAAPATLVDYGRLVGRADAACSFSERPEGGGGSDCFGYGGGAAAEGTVLVLSPR
ncbi:unnamed protein product, partial [Phaeothamnion confervicola]